MVRAKKHLGQHFLKDPAIAKRIADSLEPGEFKKVLEIGPGTGVLTQFLVPTWDTWMIEVDKESVAHLRQFPQYADRIIVGDYLKWDSSQWQEPYAIIGNFPYNISSQIFFKILDTPTMVAQVVCMLQREVAQRLTSGPGSKRYGILSVLLQAYFRLEYLFEVGPEQFHPPPKVHSAVIRLTSLQKEDIGCNPKHLKKLVKQAFQNRRKTLRNALKPFNLPAELVELPLLDRRAEQLTVAEFVSLTNKITPFWNP